MAQTQSSAISVGADSSHVQATSNDASVSTPDSRVPTPVTPQAASTSAHSVAMQAMLPLSAAKLSKLLTPLKTLSFKTLLTCHSLAEKYPTLVQYITDGFLIGPMPRITSTLIQKNHTAEPTKIAIIREDFVNEVNLGCMVGPLSIHDAQVLLNGNFCTSPLGLVPKSGSPGRFRVIHDLSYRGSAAQSVNDCIPSDRPTRWVDFEQFAAQVCVSVSPCN